MKQFAFLACIFVLVLISGCVSNAGELTDTGKIELPAPNLKGDTSLEETLKGRRSIRDYSDEPLSLEDFSQILWAAQGITSDWGGRTAPSAGALYPLELYAVVGNVEGLSPGVYRYDPKTHSVNRILDGDKRIDLQGAALGQSAVGNAAMDLVFTAVYERTTWKYGERGIRYVHLETGHAAQNVYLQCVSLGLGTVVIGAFTDEQVKGVLGIEEEPLYVMPIGHPA